MNALLARRLILVAGMVGTSLLPTFGPAVPTLLPTVTPVVLRLVRGLRMIDVPPTMRQENWLGSSGQGSCVHASLVTLLRWQGQHTLAEQWKRGHGDGESSEGLARKLTAAGIRFAQTTDGDESFLDWALRTRRGANVVVRNGAHMVTLAALDDKTATLIDSNHPEQFVQLSRSVFLKDWKQSGGWAVTPLYSPMPPSPWLRSP